MSLDKIYVHVNIVRNKNGLLYTAISRVTNPEGLLLSAFEGELFERIAKSKGMKRMQAEIARLSGLAEETRKWVEYEGIREMFDDYFDERDYTSRKHTPLKTFPIHTNSVSAAMDVTNYTGDILGSAIADHTFATDCAWRQRMHKANSRIYTLEQLLSEPAAPLGQHTTKKRKRTSTKSAEQKHKKKCTRSTRT